MSFGRVQSSQVLSAISSRLGHSHGSSKLFQARLPPPLNLLPEVDDMTEGTEEWTGTERDEMFFGAEPGTVYQDMAAEPFAYDGRPLPNAGCANEHGHMEGGRVEGLWNEPVLKDEVFDWDGAPAAMQAEPAMDTMGDDFRLMSDYGTVFSEVGEQQEKEEGDELLHGLPPLVPLRASSSSPSRRLFTYPRHRLH
ncbi:hypothetical protein HKX48_001573 [Thoreauomyces humboldtii]|nr:hypothetical protein HKX48_001573 [Thoreauomyces humboldtii]